MFFFFLILILFVNKMQTNMLGTLVFTTKSCEKECVPKNEGFPSFGYIEITCCMKNLCNVEIKLTSTTNLATITNVGDIVETINNDLPFNDCSILILKGSSLILYFFFIIVFYILNM